MKKFSFLFLFLFLAVTACQKEIEDPSIESPQSGSFQFSIEAVMPELDQSEATKAVGNAVMRLNWEKGDSISVVNLTHNYTYAHHLYADQSGTVSTFSGTLYGLKPNDGDEFGFIYPAESPAVYPPVVDFSSQKGSSNVPLGLYSRTTYHGSTQGLYLDFSFINSFYLVSLSELPENRKIDEVIFTNVGKSASRFNETGDFAFSPVVGDIVVRPEGMYSSSSGTRTVYVAMAPSPAVGSRQIAVRMGDDLYAAKWVDRALDAGRFYTTIAARFQNVSSVDEEPEQPSDLTLGNDSLFFGLGGGTFNVAVNTSRAWTCETDSYWVTVNKEGNQCSVTVTESSFARKGIVKFYEVDKNGNKVGGNVNLLIDQHESTLAPARYETVVDRKGGNGLGIEIASNSPWTVTSDVDWISFDQAEFDGDAIFRFNVAENRSAQRDGILTFRTPQGTTRTIRVRQNRYPTDADALEDMGALYDILAESVFGSTGISRVYFAAFNVPGDDLMFGSWGQSMEDLNHFRYTQDEEWLRYMYNYSYNAIDKANSILEEMDEFNSATMVRIKAEARVVRALCHFILAMGWGTPPLIDHVLAEGEQPCNYTGTQKDLYRWCARECESAAPDLRVRNGQGDKESAIVVTRGFADALAGKAYLYAEDYSKSKAKLDAVIESGNYALVPGNRYSELFHQTGDGNEEKIFEMDVYDSPNPWGAGRPAYRTGWMHTNWWSWRTDHLASSPALQDGYQGWGHGYIEESFARDFLENDGNSARRKATFMTADEWLYEMEWTSSLVNGGTLEEKMADPRRGISSTNGLPGCAAFFAHKMMTAKEDAGKYLGAAYNLTNYTVMRYAEVLLMYAEACLKSGDPAGALRAVNEIRQRAGLDALSSVTMDTIKKEKGFELWMECNRWPDMVRWGDFDKARNQGKTIPSTYDSYYTGADSETRLYVRYNANVMYDISDCGFTEKHKLFPYSTAVMTANPNIKQNPGW